ncbi:ANTAR domain-containing protein [Streptomyces sp. NPDC055078]
MTRMYDSDAGPVSATAGARAASGGEHHRRAGGRGTDERPVNGPAGATGTEAAGTEATGTEADALREEVAGLREALASHPVIDMARGMVMATASCTPEEAWQVLVSVSQHSNVKLREVARHIVNSTHGPPPPPAVRAALRSAYAALPGRGR